MTQEAINNGIVLYELGLDREQVEESLRVMKLVPELLELLKSPVIANNKKHAVIDDIYSRCFAGDLNERRANIESSAKRSKGDDLWA